jgi:hypothetical protein
VYSSPIIPIFLASPDKPKKPPRRSYSIDIFRLWQAATRLAGRALLSPVMWMD